MAAKPVLAVPSTGGPLSPIWDCSLKRFNDTTFFCSALAFCGTLMGMISKRKLRFARMTPLLGVCDYCNTQFEGTEDQVRQLFHSHHCERKDADQPGAAANPLVTSPTDPNRK